MSRLAQLKELLKGTPTDSFLLFGLAKEYEALGELYLAKEHYLKIVSTSPDYVGVYYHLGKLHESLDEPDDAIQTYIKGMEVAQALGDAHAKSELAGAKLNLELDF